MSTVKDVKQRLVDYLMSIKLEKLKMAELSIYSDVVRKADEMEKPGYAETMATLMGQAVHMGCKECDKKEVKHG